MQNALLAGLDLVSARRSKSTDIVNRHRAASLEVFDIGDISKGYRRAVARLPVEPLGDVPLPVRWTVFGAASLGVIGAIVGLIVGLLAYPPTAWFAVLELGVPAATAGAVAGLFAALIVTAGRRIMRHLTRFR